MALQFIFGMILAATGVAAESRIDFSGFARRTTEEPAEIKAFENADFEDATKFGSVDRFSEIGSFGYNGTGGLRVRHLQGKHAHVFSLKARLEKGRRYVYSMDCRRRGELGYQVAMDCCYKGTGRYVPDGGAWGESRKSIDEGWFHCQVEFVTKYAPEEVDYKFMIYVTCPNSAKDPASAENFVDVDNIAIAEVAPKWYFCNTWPTHNWLFADEGRIRCNSSFWGAYLPKDADPVYRFCLRGPDGGLLAQSVVSADEGGNMTAAFGRIAHEGAARLDVTIFDRRNRLELGTKSLALEVRKTFRPGAGDLFVREDGIVMRDGRPFMPIGFYTGLADPKKFPPDRLESELKRLRDGGFNAMIDYATYQLTTKALRDTYYGLCEKYGISVLADDFKICGPAIEKVDRDIGRYRERAAALRDYPALIGFYTLDEGSEHYVKPLTTIRRMLNELMPGRVVNICNIHRPSAYLPAADVQGGDSYPISRNPESSLRTPEERVQGMMRCAPAAVWFAPQAYNWAEKTKGAMQDPELYRRSGREPTENEILSVALCNAVNGVTGFFFYAHFDIFECPVREWIPRRWNSVSAAARVLHDLEPFIMSGRGKVEILHKDMKDPARVVGLSDGKGAWRVVVYGLGKDHKTSFTLPKGMRGLRPQCGKLKPEGGGWSFTAGDFSCDWMK